MSGFESIADFLDAVVGGLQSSPWLEVGTWFLAIVFLWAGASKLRQPTLAALAIADFGLVDRPRRWQGLGIAIIEISIGLALAAGQALELVLALTVALLLVFSALIARSLVRGDRFACMCFGGSGDNLSRLSLARTAGLAFLATLLFLSGTDAAARPLDASETYLALLMAAGSVLCLVLAGRLPGLISDAREVAATFGAGKG